MQQIEQLQKAGKIRGFCKPAKNYSAKPKINIPKRSKEKDWLEWNLAFWANEHAVTLETEYTFHPERKWRFDWAIPSLMIAIEYNGLISNKSRHTTIGGYSRDMEKINAAQKLGWTVLQYTALNYKKLLKDLNEIVP
jgi:hypothetical protein